MSNEREGVTARTASLFHEQFDRNARRTDRLFVYLMIGQWLFAVGFAVVFSPYAWEGRVRTTHAHVYTAIFLGGLVSSLPIALAFLRPGAPVTRSVVAVAQMLWSALLIHLSGGRIETHFHVFGSLAFLAFYRDWRVLVPATLVVAADHLIRQLFWPESVFGSLDPETWRFLEHAAWVLFEDAVLVMATLGAVRDMRSNAAQQARIEASERIEKEMEIATQIQTALLPRTLEVRGLELAAAMHCASEVGGDYYDVMPVDGGAWIGIGDVAGHGLTAGLVMLQTQSAIGALVGQHPTAAPSEIVVGVNKVLHQNIRHRMGNTDHVTLSMLRYHDDGRIVFAGAHEEIVVWRAATRRIETIATPGTWVGLRANIKRATRDTTCHLAEGDVMLLYTDGVTEAMDATKQQFGLDRLCAALEAVAEQPADAIRDHILGAVADWTDTQADDVTLLVARYCGVTAAAAAA
jgi:serine phosphatase RsbU (regulator of sigma subunit)